MDIEFEKFGNSGVVVKYAGKLNLETAAEYGTTVRDYIEDEDIKEIQKLKNSICCYSKITIYLKYTKCKIEIHNTKIEISYHFVITF